MLHTLKALRRRRIGHFRAAVHLGMFENRQMNATNLADYVGVPRSTMDLEELERSSKSSEGARQGREPRTRSMTYAPSPVVQAPWSQTGISSGARPNGAILLEQNDEW